MDSNFRSLGDQLAKNSRAIIALAVGFVVVAAIGALMMNKRQAKSDEAKNALYTAQQSITSQLKEIAKADNPPPPAPKAAAKDAKAPPPPAPEADPESVAFKRMDVDATLAKGVGQLKAVAAQFEGTRAAYEAQFQLGDLYFQHGQFDKAVSWFEQAMKSAPNSMEKTLAQRSLGYAYENVGKHAEAADLFERSLNTKIDAVKGDTLLALARNQVAMKDVTKARATYDRILSEMPNTEYATTAQRLKGTLGQ